MEPGREQDMSNPPSDMGKLLQKISIAQVKTSKDHQLQDYFKNEVNLHEVSFGVPTIPEGSTIKVGSMPLSSKAIRDEATSKSEKNSSGSPPPLSSAATTGTTSTPNSVGGNSDAPTVISTSTGPGATSPEPSMPHESFTASTLSKESRDNRSEQSSGSDNQMNQSKYATTPPSQSTPAPDGALTNSPSLSMTGRYNAAAFPSAIKLLMSNNVAGYIIGRSGQTVSELQAQSSTRIKLSQTGDYFPGTQDRVCLVQGLVENVKVAVRMLLERLYMLQEQHTSQGYAWQPRPPETGANAPFEFVVRLLVPASSCGMIIGKSGSNIKFMEETTGVASVRLSPKEGVITDPNFPPTAAAAALIAATSERVVTLSGPSLECCVQCTFIILDGMTLHPEICRYNNMTTSYSRVLPTAVAPAGTPPFGSGVVANNTARGPLLAIPNTSRIQGLAEGPSSLWDPQQHHQPQPLEKRVSSTPDLASQHLFLEGAMMSPISPHFAQNCETGSMPNTMTYSPREAPPPQFPHPQISPSPSPLLYLMGGMPPSSSEPPRLAACSSAPDLVAMGHQDSFATFEETFNYLQPPNNTSISPSHGSLGNQNFAGSMNAGLHGQPALPSNLSSGSAPLGMANAAAAAPVHNSPTGGFMGQVLVPDAFIGLILGRGGRTLHELQVQSGTRIRISQRGEYVPGSRDRIVNIKGPTSQSIHLAQVLIHQRMAILPLPTPPPAASMRQSHSGMQQPHHHHQQQQQQQQHHHNVAGYGVSFGGNHNNNNMMTPMGMPHHNNQMMMHPSDFTDSGSSAPQQHPPPPSSSQSHPSHSSS